MPVFVEKRVLDLPRIYINGGRPEFLVGIDSKELVHLLNAKPVDVALEKSRWCSRRTRGTMAR